MPRLAGQLIPPEQALMFGNHRPLGHHPDYGWCWCVILLLFFSTLSTARCLNAAGAVLR